MYQKYTAEIILLLVFKCQITKQQLSILWLTSDHSVDELFGVC